MNIWLLSEERPKVEVVVTILNEYTKIKNISIHVDQKNLKIEPVFYYGVFIFTYKVLGVSLDNVNEILLKIVSGKSSFVDYLVYEGSEHLPNSKNAPVMAIEETKTSDKESRNTGVSQRISKFVYLDFYYPDVKKIMLYNLKIEEQESLSKHKLISKK